MPLHKMGHQDDLEAFINLFEKSAEISGWAQEDWPVRLIPLLSWEAQLAPDSSQSRGMRTSNAPFL